MKKRQADIGILTFHCSNNYGAMLQAYGLKHFLEEQGLDVDIVRYEPPYMTGRHWWIPYAPIQGLKGRIWCLFHMWNGFLAHLANREAFAAQRASFRQFMRRFLVRVNQPKKLSLWGLKGLSYRCYVVGSDQIWNPDITCGLRKAYFGAFQARRKEKVISYAASFGGAALDPKHDQEFASLVRHVDAVSVREEAAVPYVEKLYGRPVTAVLDPVFFLGKASWQQVETIPGKVQALGEGKYIFLYVTEGNQKMAEYAQALSRETGLPVIELRAGQQGTDKGFDIDRAAGPGEFLGYIHEAAYVVSNSFHAVAFSILYEKQFLAFAHSSLGTRVSNILQIHGLSGRLCTDQTPGDIRERVDWEEVRRRTREHRDRSGAFLLGNLGDLGKA
jgi:hypothetical protein